ncbi:MAG: cell surface protein SprA [bacterium]
MSVFSVQGYVPGPLTSYATNIHQVAELESLEAPVFLRQTVLDNDVQPPMVMPFHEYLTFLQEQQMRKTWHEYAARRLNEEEAGSRGAGGINLEIPVKIKSKTFQKIFGSGTVGLVVSGDIRIQAGIRREDRSEVRTALTRGASTNFKMQQTQRFSVTGKIGEKVTVNVDQDSERAFDFDNNVRLLYQGYDDEILRRFEAGNISLSLPGTRYVTFSGKNSGLFGLKSELVLGNLNLIAIASQEKGESQKLSLSGGATSGSNRVQDYRYLKDQYFFLDMEYRSRYRFFTADGVHIAVPDSGVVPDSIDVYKAAPNNDINDPDKVIEGRAWFDSDSIGVGISRFQPKEGEKAQGQFIRLEPNEYFVQYDQGWIRLNTPLADGEILAVAYRTRDDRRFGDLNFVRDTTVTNDIINLKLVRDRKNHPDYLTWDLAWKHVYSLGSRKINEDGFEVKILFNEPGSVPQEVAPDRRNWLEVFGLDRNNQNGIGAADGIIDIDVNIVDLENGELHFRDLRPFDPVGYFMGNGFIRELQGPDSTFRVREIYTETDPDKIRLATQFEINVKTQNRGTEYNLGFNVIEGSEVVTLNGRTLQKDRDYTIDYFSGQLIMLNDDAANPSAQLDITYERNQLFQLEKKTILGMRTEYNLGRDSFIGGTLLYLSESTLDQKVRVGRGPMRNVVWDVNSKLKLTPNFIGRAFNALPLIRANGQTTLNLEGEVAQVLPTPNTLNNTRTGDNRGVAYIDDFEAAKKAVNLGVLRRNWTIASGPEDGIHNYRNKLNNFIWYNPFDQVNIKDIFPERDTQSRTGGQAQNRTHVLTMEFFNPGDEQPNPKRWGGIMRALSAGFFDQTQTKFIEIMVQGDNGRVHIDLGSISEDVIKNNDLDTEDRTVPRNGALDPGEDIGIDGVAKIDPPVTNFPRKVGAPQGFAGPDSSADIVPFDFWDINGDGIKNHDEPWSYDDWFYNSGRQYIFFEGSVRSINGSEGSENDEGGRLPDSEDINGNGILDPSNNYFTYSFSLRPDSPDSDLIVGGNPNNPESRGGPWKLYRIPFITNNDSFRVGDPTATLIEYVRIWVDSLEFEGDQRVRISIAEINMVGSEWKEIGIAKNRSEFDLQDRSELTPPEEVGDRFAVAQINTHDSPFYASTLEAINVQGEEDKVTGVQAREQSLVLKAITLNSGEAGIAQKSLFQGENYIHYDRIKMFVYGDDPVGSHLPVTETDTSGLEYFVRFGTNNNNYYEYRSRVYPGWDDRNHMDLPILEFTTIDPSLGDTSGLFFEFDSTVVGKRIVQDGVEKELRVKGTPSFTNIRVLTLGIKNVDENGTPFTGDVWFNELRLSEVEQDRGMAMRGRFDLRIADFASVNGEIERKEADFHNVATRFGTGDNSLSKSLNANISLDKMLPQALGISMPLTLNFRENTSTPKYFPGQDREVIARDLDDPDLRNRVEKVNKQTGFNISFKRSAKSKNFFVKNLIDNLSVNLGRSSTDSKTPSAPVNKNTRWTGNVEWRLDFGRNNYFSPFAWLPNLPLINKAKETKLYYTPQSVTARVNGTRIETMRQNRIRNTNELAEPDENLTFNSDRNVRASMKVLESLNVTYSRSHKAQLRDKEFKDFFQLDFNDTDQNQQFQTTYSPTVFSWLSNTFKYNVNYRFSSPLQNRDTGRRASNDISRSADFTFRWKQLLNSVFGGGSKGARGRGRRGRPTRGRPGGERDQPRNELSFLQQKKTGKSFNPLKAVGSFFSGFKDVQFTYSERENHTQAGLAAGQKPSLAFQFGGDSTGVGTAEGVSGNLFSSGLTKNMSLNSGIALGRAIDISLRYNQSDQENTSTTSTGTTAQGNNTISYLAEKELNIPFPEWTVAISGLQGLPLFNKVFNNVTFSHGYSGQRTENWRGQESNLNSRNISSNFRPLGKLTLNFKNGFTGNIQVNRGRTSNLTFSTNSEGQLIELGENRNENDDLTISANYSKRSGFRLPIWPFNKAELKNSINFIFSFTASKVTTKNRQGNGDFVVTNSTERWTVRPEVKYSFSNTVRGGAFIEIGKTTLKKTGTTKVQEFGIDINIAIRGN